MCRSRLRPLIDLGRLKDVGWQGETALRFELEWDNGDGIAFQVRPYIKTGLVVNRETFSVKTGGKRYSLQGVDNVEPWYFSFLLPRHRRHPQRLIGRSPRPCAPLMRPSRIFLLVCDILARCESRSVRFLFPERNRKVLAPDARFLIPFLKFRPDVTARISRWQRERGLASGLEVRETAKRQAGGGPLI